MRRLALSLGIAALGCDGAGAEAVPAPVAAAQPVEPVPAAAPADPAAIGGWLRASGYRDWPAQSRVHATSEHGGARVFFNETLAASMRAGTGEHPIGSAAVRELYEGDLVTLRGFAVMLKLRASGPGGEGWLWYEQFGTDAGAKRLVAGTGERGCVGCHDAGIDFVHPPEPG
ncbi:hypothetical protein SAMN02745121_07987 [Nannocystis exedens]|uniref:Cytochrome P460 domain-containing protein n=1 Tax=Nannocystis exedens TaxID=54 RepID=A0A1I2HKX5_9BACT|nr:cytochrome P460 family protein [Nannocystis exedens]PCC74163.1 hypothetical protein NAEX_07252 [Nannocystis exedens]SFF29507.1 hypothetical protein SAMN02745121_07987 [Nannocystis exedens]